MIQLTVRDQKLMALIAHYGMISTHQAGDFLFRGIRKTTLLRRLRLLERENFIRRVQALSNAENVWLLTRKGEVTLGFENTAPIVNRNTLQHDLTLVEVRISLERLGLGENWISERTLKQQVFSHERRNDERLTLIPDAIFTAAMDQTRVIAIEVELSPKSVQRYQKIFQRYVSQRNITFIWYLVANEAFGRWLLARWKATVSAINHGSIAFTLIDEIKSNPRSARIFFIDWESTTESLFRLPTPTHTSAHSMSTPEGATEKNQ